MSIAKSCYDCKHHLQSGYPYLCKAPQLRDHLTIHPAEEGKQQQNTCTYADTLRDVTSLCGLEARWFEPKEKE